MKTIDLDWEHKDDILKQMMQFLKDLEAEMEQKKQEIKSEYSKEFQRMKDLKDLISDCRHPNGLPISKVEMKTAKADLKEQKKELSGVWKNLSSSIQRLHRKAG